jgi:hypothetical protein
MLRRSDDRTGDMSPEDVEQGEEAQERARKTTKRNDLDRRVKSWARRSANKLE